MDGDLACMSRTQPTQLYPLLTLVVTFRKADATVGLRLKACKSRLLAVGCSSIAAGSGCRVNSQWLSVLHLLGTDAPAAFPARRAVMLPHKTTCGRVDQDRVVPGDGSTRGTGLVQFRKETGTLVVYPACARTFWGALFIYLAQI